MTDFSFEQSRDIGLKYVLDRLEPSSPYGAKRLKNLAVYAPANRAELVRELDNVSVMFSALEKQPDKVDAVRHLLSTLKDVSGALKNCEIGILTEIELFELTAFLLRIKQLIPQVESISGYVDMEGTQFVRVEDPLRILDPCGKGALSFYVEDSRTPELLRLRRKKREIDEMLRLQGANTDELMAQRLAIVSAQEQELLSIYAAMTQALRPMLPLMQKNGEAAGRLDAALSKAVLARRFSGVMPKIGGDTLFLEEAVNPEVAEYLNVEGRSFTPIDIELPQGVTILTGANMGGKSVAIKTITLNAALALMGFFVFCKKAKVPMFDRFELINRDFSSVESGLSGFGGEIVRFNEAVGRLSIGGLSFIAMDEFARGTNAEEGSAIVRSVVKYLNSKKTVTILATHYDGAAQYAQRRYQVRGLRNKESKDIDFRKQMDYGLMRVNNDADCPCEAVAICRLLGMEEEILMNIEMEE